eukprot:s3710_g10.t1
MAARPRVLVDSGVNEEIRPRPEGFALNKCRRSQLALASGATFHAWRTRDGELMIGDEEMDQSADWIVSVRRLRGIRGAFVWDEVGPKVMYIDGDTTVTVHCFEQNGLPYIWWEYFKPIKASASTRAPLPPPAALPASTISDSDSQAGDLAYITPRADADARTPPSPPWRNGAAAPTVPDASTPEASPGAATPVPLQPPLLELPCLRHPTPPFHGSLPVTNSWLYIPLLLDGAGLLGLPAKEAWRGYAPICGGLARPGQHSQPPRPCRLLTSPLLFKARLSQMLSPERQWRIAPWYADRCACVRILA